MQTKFKIGDKVKVLTKAYPLVYNMEGVVTKVAEGGVYQVERVVENQPSDQYGYFGNDCWRFAFHEEELELVEDKPKTKFKVGDKVRCIDATDSSGILRVGDVFTVTGEYEDMIMLENRAVWFTYRFELVTDQEVSNTEPTYVIGQEVYVAAGITRNLKPAVIIDAVVRNGLLKVSVDGFDCFVEEERVYTRVEAKGE